MLFEYHKGHPQDILDKYELTPGKEYNGVSRNTSKAIWTGRVFKYKHTEWYGDIYEETLPHPRDDEGYDVFMPLRSLNA